MACHPIMARWITKAKQALKSYHQEFHHIISAAFIHSPIGATSLGGIAFIIAVLVSEGGISA